MSKTLTRWILVNAALTLLIATFAIRLHAAGLVEENRRLLSDVVRRMERDCAAGIAPACDVALEARNSAGEFLDLSERCEFGQRAACQMVAQHRHELLSVLEISRHQLAGAM